MTIDNELHRWERLVAQVSAEAGWSLPAHAIQRYSSRLRNCWVSTAGIGDDDLRVAIVNYHADHAVVEALRNADHPEHGVAWLQWTEQALKILAGRYANVSTLDEAAVNTEDLAQDAMRDLWQALRTFRYESRFRTWAFTIISNCYLRTYRSINSVKRTVGREALSLTTIEERGDALFASESQGPDEEVFSAELVHVVQSVLQHHPDRRLMMIFRLSVQEDQPLRVVSQRLQLSVPRVHALLNQALTLLRNDESLRTWVVSNS